MEKNTLSPMTSVKSEPLQKVALSNSSSPEPVKWYLKKPSLKYVALALFLLGAVIGLVLFFYYYDRHSKTQPDTQQTTTTPLSSALPIKHTAPPLPVSPSMPHFTSPPFPTPPTGPNVNVPNVPNVPNFDSDLNTILIYLLKRGTSLDNIRWSEDEVLILKDESGWIRLSPKKSDPFTTYFYPQGIQTTESYELFFDLSEKKWNLRPVGGPLKMPVDEKLNLGLVPRPISSSYLPSGCAAESPEYEIYKKTHRTLYQVVVHHHHHYH